jgi:hypothetical protein
MALGSLILDELILAVILVGATFLAILGSAGPMLLNSSVTKQQPFRAYNHTQLY